MHASIGWDIPLAGPEQVSSLGTLDLALLYPKPSLDPVAMVVVMVSMWLVVDDGCEIGI